MKPQIETKGPRFATGAAVAVALAITLAPPIAAQASLPVPTAPPATQAPPSYSLTELDRIVSPIALYPDPLLGQVLTAATYPADIPDAARWADDHHYLIDKRLTDAMAADHVPWDPAVQALLPFAGVLERMASEMPWTQELGDAFLADPNGVMDAVQRMRQKAWGYGYLGGCAPLIIHSGPFVEILPDDPAFIVVPYYDPAIVFFPPRPGFVVGQAVYCGFGIRLGAWFGPWGWGTTRFVWANHGLIINNEAWRRTWPNRATYVHPSSVPKFGAPRPPERHPVRPRTPAERAGERPTSPRGRESQR